MMQSTFHHFSKRVSAIVSQDNKWCRCFTTVQIVFVLSVVHTQLDAQDLATIGKGNALSLSGGINANSVFYDAMGIDERRDPFNYFLSGNFSITLYGWSAPVSFSYSNQQSAFQQPFNQYGLSPTYKWITTHVGYRSMLFSGYTVNGHLFMGGGFDITPSDKIKVSAFYGRLQKTVEEDTLDVDNIPAYKRMGGGAKITFGGPKNNMSLIVFKARDEINSLDVEPVTSDVNPEENLVLGVGFSTSLSEQLSVNGEYASSAITKDTRSRQVRANNLYSKLNFAFSARESSSYYSAVKVGLAYAFINAGIGLSYERIDPGYRTLGAYYFNNNLQSFAFTGTTALANKKVRVNGQVGLQRNNLDQKELNTMNRFSGAINVNCQLSTRFMIASSYSNFQTVINFRSQFDHLNQVNPYDRLDTMNYQQIAQNANININYLLSENKERRQNLNVNLSFQKTADIQADIEQPTGARFYNVNGNYAIVLVPHKVTLNIAANANFTDSQTASNRIYGPSGSIRRTFFKKKLSANATISYNESYLNGNRTGEVANTRIGATYTWKDNHQFDLTLTQSKRFSVQNDIGKKVNELTLQLGYNYNFRIN